MKGIEFRVFPNYHQMSDAAAKYILAEVQQHPDLLLCPAAGSTPTDTYEQLVTKAISNNINTKDLKVVKLDEWVGVPNEDPVTCEYQIKNQLINPLKITNYCGFNSENEDTDSEIKKYETYLSKNAPIDLCVLGLGLNGHLGFNEPSDDFLSPFPHKVQLTAQSMSHPMVSEMPNKPSNGITLGMQNLLTSKAIIILVNGKNKKQPLNQLKKGQISTNFPASFLWLHPNVICFCDEEAYN